TPPTSQLGLLPLPPLHWDPPQPGHLHPKPRRTNWTFISNWDGLSSMSKSRRIPPGTQNISAPSPPKCPPSDSPPSRSLLSPAPQPK
ncbi:hypothetical protein CAEBREN_29605, partial [Caenorhabditis brenneri]